jgi:hypothetical protein
MLPAMLGGRAFDQQGQVFAGEPTNLDPPTLYLFVELQPVGEACGRRVKESQQAARPTVVDIGPDSAAITPP